MSEEQAPQSEPGHGTPEGYTAEKPYPAEKGEPGAPADPHHDSATHMDAHTTLSDDDHGHEGEALGPIDWGAWAVALVAAAAGLVVAAMFWVAIS